MAPWENFARIRKDYCHLKRTSANQPASVAASCPSPSVRSPGPAAASMMSEEKKAQDLEFIDVEAGDGVGLSAAAAAPTNVKSPASKKREDGEALYVHY